MKYIFQIVICAALIVACKNETTKTPSAPAAPAEATAILKHKYWVSKAFADALFAANVPDTLNRLWCGELMFAHKDTVWLTTCRFRSSPNNPPVGQLAQRRMAGNYRLVPKKGQIANAAIAEVSATGGLTNFEGFDSFFPIPTGVACYFNPKKEMMMVNFTKGKADISTITRSHRRRRCA